MTPFHWLPARNSATSSAEGLARQARPSSVFSSLRRVPRRTARSLAAGLILCAQGLALAAPNGAARVAKAVPPPKALYAYDLGNLNAGVPFCAVADINDSGQVVGRTVTADGKPHAFITAPAGQGMRDVGLLGSPHEGEGESGAHAVNNSGVIVGWSQRGFQNILPMMTEANGMNPFMVKTPTNPYGWRWDYRDFLLGVNDAGQTVGYYTDDLTHQIQSAMTSNWGQTISQIPRIEGGEIFLKSINDAGAMVGFIRYENDDFQYSWRSYVLPQFGDEPIIVASTKPDRNITAGHVNNVGKVLHSEFRNGNEPSKILITDMAGNNRVYVAHRRPDAAFPLVADMTDDGLMVGYARYKGFKVPLNIKAWAIDETGNDWSIEKLTVNLPEGIRLREVTAVNRFKQMAVQAYAGDDAISDTLCFIVCPEENCTINGKGGRLASPAEHKAAVEAARRVKAPRQR